MGISTSAADKAGASEHRKMRAITHKDAWTKAPLEPEESLWESSFLTDSLSDTLKE